MAGSPKASAASNGPRRKAGSSEEANENTPLLANEIASAAGVSEAAAVRNERASEDDGDDKPLPKVQIALLCFARFVEPMAFFSIFPYINKMVQENGHLAEADVGFYSGLIESLFSLTQAIVMIFWGKASDRFGRKPVLVFSLFGVTIATAIFGLAQSVGQMIVFRCLAGVFAGTIVTIRTMISEHSTAKTQARAFSWFAFAGNLGIFMGPLLGGALADPAQQYPGAFGHIRFLHDYPYFLSTFVVAALGLIAAVVSAIFVEETLKREPKPKAPTPADGNESGNGNTAAIKLAGKGSIWQLVTAPGVGMVLYVYSHVMLLAFAYTAVVPVFWFTSVGLGGFGFSLLQISLMMGLNGISQAMWLLLVFPPLQKRLGTNGVMRVCGYAYPWLFALMPCGNLLLREGSHAAIVAFWCILPAGLSFSCGVSMSFTAIQLALNDISPSPQVLGTLNALSLTLISIIRAFAPALFTSLFALGANTQWLWGYFIWLIMFLGAAGFSIAVLFLPDPELVKAKKTRQQAEAGGSVEE